MMDNNCQSIYDTFINIHSKRIFINNIKIFNEAILEDLNCASNSSTKPEQKDEFWV